MWSFLHSIGNKIPMKGITETKFGAKMKGWTIRRLSHPGMHPIISHQTQTLLHMPERFCWRDPVILIWGYASACQIQKWMFTVIYWMDHRASNGGARESIQGAEGVCNPIGGTTIWTNQYPQSCICSRRWHSRPSLGRKAPCSCKLYMFQHSGTLGPRSGSGWVGEQGGGRL